MKVRKAHASKKLRGRVFWILVEGKETERNYISGYIRDYLKKKDWLRESIQIYQPTSYSPLGLMEEAMRQKRGDDVSWLVFDCDQHPNKEFVFQKAKENGIEISYSSICFEEWILLHCRYSTKAFSSCDELEKELDKQENFKPGGYRKNLDSLFAVANGKDGQGVARARENAKKLCAYVKSGNLGKNVVDLNPYTNFHELLGALDDFVEK